MSSSSALVEAAPNSTAKVDMSVTQHLTQSTDMLAELSLGTGDQTAEKAEAAEAAAEASLTISDLAGTPVAQDVDSSAQQTAPATEQAEQPGTGLQLTPEQDAAAAECANQFVELYECAFLNRAVQLVTKTCEEQGIPESAVAEKLRTRGVDLQQLKGRAAEVAKGIAECASDDGWKLIQDGKLRLMYRHTPGTSVHGFKGSCLLPAPMSHPMCMAREFDLVNSWNSYITNSPVLRTFCDVDMLVYASVWLPWPFAERDVIISAVADDNLKDQGVVAVSFASPRETPPGVELPAGADQRVHIYFTSGSCMTMRPVAPAGPAAVEVSGGAVSQGDAGQQQTQVVIVANIETTAYVPEAIISFVLKVFAPFMYSTVLKVLHKSFDDPNEPLPQRMAQHHELYDMIMTRCQEYLEGHPE